MDLWYEISIALTCIPILMLMSVKLWYSAVSKRVARSLLFFAIFYGVIVYGAAIQEVYLDRELAKFDLNGDGIFSGNELTAEQGAAMSRVVRDTARTFAPYTGFVLSGIASIILYVAQLIVHLVVGYVREPS